MTRNRLAGVCFFGGYADDYPRSVVIKRGVEALGIPVYSCRTSPRRKIFSRYAGLIARYLKMPKDFSILFVPEFRHKDVPLARVLALLSGKRLVFDPLVSRYETKIIDRGDAGARSFQSWYNRRIDWLALKLPHLVLADTEAHAAHYRAEFGAKNIAVLPVGFDDTVFASPAALEKTHARGGGRTVLFFGSYVPLHGAETIVDAAIELRRRSDIRFKMIGGGQTFGAARERAESAGLDTLEFVPRIPYGELPRHIEEAGICLGIFGTTEKALRVIPNKVYQCLAMRKPVITADSPAIREYFADGEHLFTVPAGDSKALADKISYLIANPAVADDAAGNGSDLVWKQFSSGAVGERFVDLCTRDHLQPRGERDERT